MRTIRKRKDLSKAAIEAAETERLRPCRLCANYSPSAQIGSCRILGDFHHTCFRTSTAMTEHERYLRRKEREVKKRKKLEEDFRQK